MIIRRSSKSTLVTIHGPCWHLSRQLCAAFVFLLLSDPTVYKFFLEFSRDMQVRPVVGAVIFFRKTYRVNVPEVVRGREVISSAK
jgi:hypothetical protein